MAGNEAMNRNEIEELTPEALEEAAGGAGKTGKRLRVIRDTKIYSGYGQVFGTVRKGTVYDHYNKWKASGLDFACYRVVLDAGVAYIPCDCAEVI